MNDHLANAALVVTSVLLVLAVLEAALVFEVVETHADKNWDVEKERQTCEFDHSHGRPEANPTFHPEYGWSEVPNVLFDVKRTPAQEWERHEINDEGFRDVYDTGDQGVIVFGDSFTYGILGSNDETYPHLLDRWNPNVSVHNYGMWGYGPPQYYLIYEDRAEEIDHDLVVVGYYLGNDMKDSVDRDPARPRYNLSDGELQQVNEPVPERDPAGWSDISKERGLRVTMALLDRINQIAAENDAEVLVVTLPTKGGVMGSGWKVHTRQREAIDQYADDDANVHTLHTKPVLASERKNRRVYGVYDTHLDDYGYYVVARTVQSWLVENHDETGVEVTTEPGESPDGGLLAGISARLRYHTESYGFLTRRSRLLAHRSTNAIRRDPDVCD